MPDAQGAMTAEEIKALKELANRHEMELAQHRCEEAIEALKQWLREYKDA